MNNRIPVKTGFLIALCLLGAMGRAEDHPLSKDDVTLLLIGGAAAEKMVPLIQQRGIDFQMTPELEKRFRTDGADDAIIRALETARLKTGKSPAASMPPSTPAVVKPSPAAAQERTAPAPSAKGAKSGELADPGPDQIQHTIQEFAAKETLFRVARDNYTYHQINKVDELGPEGDVVGTFRQDWDILFDDLGKRIEQVTYAPADTLKGVIMTKEDLESFRKIQPFVLTTDDLPEYDIKYLGHVRVDELTTYVFSVRPKEIKKGKQYFQGVVWVDDRDLQIVKSEGKNVPEGRGKKGEYNLFPRFTTYREQIDGKFWFPTYTAADDTLYFPGNPVRIREVIRYSDYKQFKASSTIKIVTELPSPKRSADTKTLPPDRH